MKIKALLQHPMDNVALALMDLQAGTELKLTVKDQTHRVKLVETIKYQHKFSVTKIEAGDKVIRYGEVIGQAIRRIKPGEHVHVHNMTGLRGKPITA